MFHCLKAYFCQKRPIFDIKCPLKPIKTIHVAFLKFSQLISNSAIYYNNLSSDIKYYYYYLQSFIWFFVFEAQMISGESDSIFKIISIFIIILWYCDTTKYSSSPLHNVPSRKQFHEQSILNKTIWNNVSMVIWLFGRFDKILKNQCAYSGSSINMSIINFWQSSCNFNIYLYLINHILIWNLTHA